ASHPLPKPLRGPRGWGSHDRPRGCEEPPASPRRLRARRERDAGQGRRDGHAGTRRGQRRLGGRPVSHAAAAFDPTPVPAPPAPTAAPAARGPSPLAWLAIVGAVIGLGFLLRGLVIPIGLAALLAYFLNPLAAQIQSLGIRRTVAVTTLFAAF